MRPTQSILFLQGVASPFFSALAQRFADEGCPVYRVNFCGGDCFFDKQINGNFGWDYQQPIDQFPDWLSDKFTEFLITDIVLFGDSRPVHANAIKLARSSGINVHVYEEGYLRPHRITLDKNGVNAASSLPRNPDWYREQGGKFPSYPSEDTGTSLWVRAWHDVRYHLASFVMRKKFPHYSTHRPDSPLREYLGWARRFPTLLFHDWNGNRLIKNIISAQESSTQEDSDQEAYYFLPLQLSADTQIRVHSSFNNISEVIEYSVSSFAANAPSQTRLVIKNHPLDTGLVNYNRLINNLIKQYDLKARVVYLEDGYLPTMVKHAKGVILVNSTVGMSSLYHRRPTCVLGKAIYNMEGLTYQCGLDRFWLEGKPPELDLYHKFCNAIIHLTQINGDLYSKKGIDMSVEGSMRFFNLSPLEQEAVIDDIPLTPHSDSSLAVAHAVIKP